MIWYGRWVSSYKDGDALIMRIDDQCEYGLFKRNENNSNEIHRMNMSNGEFEKVDHDKIYMVMPNEPFYFNNMDKYLANTIELQKKKAAVRPERRLKYNASTIL